MSNEARPSASSREEELGALAGAQHGLFTRDQAVAVGFPRTTISNRVRSRVWVAVDYGVYRAATSTPSWRQRLLAACLCGPAVASHRAAASLWGAPSFDAPPIEVTAFRHRRRSRRDDVIWHETVRLEPYERRIIDAIPVTEPARTLLDLGACADELRLGIALDDFIARGLTSIPAIYARIEQLGELRRGAGAVLRMLERRTRSERGPTTIGESTFDQVMHDAGLPAPTPQVVIHDADGNYVGRADFGFLEQRILIEIQSKRWHDGPERRRVDEDRFGAYAALGYRVIPVETTDLRDNPAKVVMRVATALQAQR